MNFINFLNKVRPFITAGKANFNDVINLYRKYFKKDPEGMEVIGIRQEFSKAGEGKKVLDFPQKRTFKEEIETMESTKPLTEEEILAKYKKMNEQAVANLQAKKEGILATKQIDLDPKRKQALRDEYVEKLIEMENKTGKPYAEDQYSFNQFLKDKGLPSDLDYATGGRVGYQVGGPATPEQYLSALQKVGAGSAEQKTRSLGDYVLNYATQAGQQLFPEGNFQRIRSAAPTQRDYNIQATADLVRNLPGGLAKDIVAPAAAAALSLPYDAIQAYTRMKPESGIKGYFDAFMAENPFSSLVERFTGAAGPLAERFSSTPLETKPITSIQSTQTTPSYVLPYTNFLDLLKGRTSGTFGESGEYVPFNYSMYMRPDQDIFTTFNKPMYSGQPNAEQLYQQYLQQTPNQDFLNYINSFTSPTDLTATEGSFAKGGSVDDTMGMASLFTRRV